MGLSGSLSGAGFGGVFSGASVNVFDSGLHVSQRSAIVTALIERIASELKTAEAGRYLRAVKQVPRMLKGSDPEEIKLLVDELQGQAPGVLVALGRKTYEAAGMDIPATNYRATIGLALYIVSANARSRDDGRLSTDVAGASSPTADPGVFTICEHLEELLLGQELNIKSVSEIRPEWEDELITFGDLTVWEQHYTIGVERLLNPDRDNDVALTDIEADHDLEDADPVNPIVTTISTMEPQ